MGPGHHRHDRIRGRTDARGSTAPRRSPPPNAEALLSTVVPETLSCPRCGAEVAFERAHGINARRRPDHRAAILDHTLHRVDCGSCGAAVRLEPDFVYVDPDRGDWILAEPAAGRQRWGDLDEAARLLFDTHFGPARSATVRRTGAGLTPRAVFGWDALREKLLCSELDLDDVAVEIAKLALLAELGDVPLADDVDLRLVGTAGEDLLFAALGPAGGAPLEEYRVPRAAVEPLAEDPAWADAALVLGAGPFVDLDRVLLPGGEA